MRAPVTPVARRPLFVDHCAELLAALGPVRVKRMFGGWGLYVDDIFLALIAYERLFLKADAETRAAFEAEGCEPFVYSADGKSVSLGYWSAPAEALDSPALMQPWARLALQAALRARAAKPVKASSRASAGPAPPAAPKARTTKTATRRAAPASTRASPKKPKPG
jgi:DNA transformation protein and related proteins